LKAIKIHWPVIFFLCLTAFIFPKEKQAIILSVKGRYLIYSFDYKQIYGQEVEIKSDIFKAKGKELKIDLTSSSMILRGKVVVEMENKETLADELIYNLKNQQCFLKQYEEEIKEITLIDKIDYAPEKERFHKKGLIDNESFNDVQAITISKIQDSFIYFTGNYFEIDKEFNVFGTNVLLYVEGIESVGFKRIKLSDLNRETQGLQFNNLWFSRSRGIVGKLNFQYKGEKINSFNQLYFEEHTVLKNFIGPKRQFDLISSTNWNIKENNNLSILSNFSSTGLWNTTLSLNNSWTENFITNFSLVYNKPIKFKGEAWLEFQSSWNNKKIGLFSFSGRYGSRNQVTLTLMYNRSFLKNFNLYFTSNYFQTKLAGVTGMSRIYSGGITLSYSSRLFNFSSNYFLNSDLLNDQTLIQPQINFSLNPIKLYAGLLSFNLQNVFIYNMLRYKTYNDSTSSNNIILSLLTEPLLLSKGFSLSFNLSLEQFLETHGRNFTSAGVILNIKKSFSNFSEFELFYNVQSRRKTKNWFIEGTTNQDLSLLVRLFPENNDYSSWFSLSYDPKNNQLRQSFLDVSIKLIKNWKFHSILNYDFLFKKVNNVDLFILRDVGLFQLRFVWRSLSKQFLVELIPHSNKERSFYRRN